MLVFENYLRSQSDLKESEVQLIISFAIKRDIRKNDFILQQGEVCRHKTFIVNGYLYTYALAENGQQTIIQFSTENNWILDAESYDAGLPSQYQICALENSKLLMWQKKDFDLLLLEIPTLKQFSQQLISRNLHATRQRLLTALSASPEDKYEEFIKLYPSLQSRLPLRMIAAYLGISLKTLNRVRHAQLMRS